MILNKDSLYDYNKKLNVHISALCLIIQILIYQGCYTIIQQTYTVTPQLKPDFPLNSTINNELSGVWIKKVLWLDYGYQIQRFEFSNGKVVYIPSSEGINSEVYLGNYRTLADTLLLKFSGTGDIGMMTYKIDGNSLFLSNVGDDFVKISFREKCTTCTGTWTKSIY